MWGNIVGRAPKPQRSFFLQTLLAILLAHDRSKLIRRACFVSKLAPRDASRAALWAVYSLILVARNTSFPNLKADLTCVRQLSMQRKALVPSGLSLPRGLNLPATPKRREGFCPLSAQVYVFVMGTHALSRIRHFVVSFVSSFEAVTSSRRRLLPLPPWKNAPRLPCRAR